jgi:hypothetical protein
MATLYNSLKNAQLNIELLNDSNLDIVKGRSHICNWIGFSFDLNVENERFEYGKARKTMFNVWELNDLILNLEKIIVKKSNEDPGNYRYTFDSFDNYFSLTFYESEALQDMLVEVWPNMNELNISNGIEKGFRFKINLEVLKEFVSNIKKDFIDILDEFDISFNQL